MNRTLIITLLFLFLSAEHANALGKIFPGFKKGANSRTETEGRVEHCTTGTCHSKSLAAGGPSRLPNAEGVLSTGIKRTLANLYGNCAAAYPLNSIHDNHDITLQHSRYNLTGSGSDLDRSRLHIPGISSETIDGGFDNVRSVNPNASPFGPYESAAKGGRTCRGSISVNGDVVDPTRVHKMFGNGAAGRLIGGDFNSFSCGSQKYLAQQTDVQKAFRCGLHPKSAAAIALDCAELIGASAIATCKKLHPNQTIDGQGIRLNGKLLSTRTLAPNPCLPNANVSAEAPVSSGDIFVMGGHSIVITDVGHDPFGLDKVGGDCNAISSQKFNFAFAQSSSFKEIGPVQSTAKAYDILVRKNGYPADHFPLSRLVQMAKTMCLAKKSGRPTSGSSKNFLQGSDVRQLRHNSNSPSCSYPPGKCPKSTGSDCLRSCGV